jgi:Putative DNA-binding domain
MSLTRKPLREISAQDVRDLCADQEAEGHEIEFKRELPARSGQRDSWAMASQIGEYARNEIAKEIVAFANTYGGTLLVGIDETKDKPSRAKEIVPISQTHELARRLRQAVYDIIDPPLPMLEAIGIVTEADGTSGVVLLRVPPSRRRPHRSNANREVYVRRIDESVPVDMRLIHELTMQAVIETRRVEDEIGKGRGSFKTQFFEWLGMDSITESVGAATVSRPVPKPGTALHLLATPTSPIDLGRVTGRSELYPKFPAFKLTIDDRDFEALWPFFEPSWRPMLRAIVSEQHEADFAHKFLLRTNGCCEIAFFQRKTPEGVGYFIEWLMCLYAGMLFWIERIRRAAGAPGLEFALAAQFVTATPAVIAPYAARQFREHQKRLPVGDAELPIMSVGDRREFDSLLQQFDEDIWNYAGVDPRRGRMQFDLKPHDELLT